MEIATFSPSPEKDYLKDSCKSKKYEYCIDIDDTTITTDTDTSEFTQSDDNNNGDDRRNAELWDLLIKSKRRLRKPRSQLIREESIKRLLSQSSEEESGGEEEENDLLPQLEDHQKLVKKNGEFMMDEELQDLWSKTCRRIKAASKRGTIRSSILHEFYCDDDDDLNDKNWRSGSFRYSFTSTDTVSTYNDMDNLTHPTLQRVCSSMSEFLTSAEKDDDEEDLNSLKQTVDDLREEIKNYPNPGRDLLVFMMMAEEAAHEGESNFSSELMNKKALAEDLELAGGMDAIIEAFSIEAALSFHRIVGKEEEEEEEEENMEEENCLACVLL